MKMIFLPLLAAVAGCATLPMGQQPVAENVRTLAISVEGALRQMVLDLNAGGPTPDWQILTDRLQWAQAEVAGNAVWATGPSAHVHYAAAAVTLKLCLNGINKMQDMPRAEAALLARGNFSLTCLMPLSALAVG